MSTTTVRPQVRSILAQIAALGQTHPEESALLRRAVAGLSLASAPYGRPLGPPEPLPAWLSTTEVAQVLRLSPDKVRQLAAQGAFGPQGAIQLRNRKGSPWRIRRTAVAAFIRRSIRGAA